MNRARCKISVPDCKALTAYISKYASHLSDMSENTTKYQYPAMAESGADDLFNALASALRTVPGKLRDIENRIMYDGILTKDECQQFVVKVQSSLSDLSRLRALCEEAGGRPLDDKIEFEVSQLELSSKRLIDKIVKMLEPAPRQGRIETTQVSNSMNRTDYKKAYDSYQPETETSAITPSIANYTPNFGHEPQTVLNPVTSSKNPNFNTERQPESINKPGTFDPTTSKPRTKQQPDFDGKPGKFKTTTSRYDPDFNSEQQPNFDERPGKFKTTTTSSFDPDFNSEQQPDFDNEPESRAQSQEGSNSVCETFGEEESYPHDQLFQQAGSSTYVKHLLATTPREGSLVRTKSKTGNSQINVSLNSAKIKLQTEAALNAIDIEYLEKQTEREKKRAARDARRAQEDAEEKAWERSAPLLRRRDELDAQLKIIESTIGESEIVSSSHKLSTKDKTRAYVASITSGEVLDNYRVSSASKLKTRVKYPPNPCPNPSNPDYLPGILKTKSRGPLDRATRETTSIMSVSDYEPKEKTYDNFVTVRAKKPVVRGNHISLAFPPESLPRTIVPTRREPPVYPEIATHRRQPSNNDNGLPKGIYGRVENKITTPEFVPDDRRSNPDIGRLPKSRTRLPPLFSTPVNNNSSSSNDSSDRVIQAVCEQMALSRLPIMEPPIFTGQDPLLFPVWKDAFDVLINHKAINDAERLHFLSRYVSGEARKAIQGYFMLSTGAYNKSYQMLVERYGNQFKVASSFRQKLKTWQKISSTDSAGLREYVDYLRQCETAMSSIPALSILNDEYENVEMIKKLPGWLSRKWINRIAIYREEEYVLPFLQSVR